MCTRLLKWTTVDRWRWRRVLVSMYVTCTWWDCAGNVKKKKNLHYVILASIMPVEQSSIKWGTCQSPMELTHWCRKTFHCDSVAPPKHMSLVQLPASHLQRLSRYMTNEPRIIFKKKKPAAKLLQRFSFLFLFALFSSKQRKLCRCHVEALIPPSTFFTATSGCPLGRWTARLNLQ